MTPSPTTDTAADRSLDSTLVEGEIGLVIDYAPGQSRALDVLGGAMALIEALDQLDRALLSSVNTELDPVSILNDVQHSSLKMLLARVIKKVPDEYLGSLEWKKWVGSLLVKGKHRMLSMIDADAPAIAAEIKALESDYRAAPGMIGFDPPNARDVHTALNSVSRARALLSSNAVTIQSDLGDIVLHAPPEAPALTVTAPAVSIVNHGREFLKVRYPDMLGTAQWTVMRSGRSTRVEILHHQWLTRYHAREFTLLPGDSLDCSFEETVEYDNQRTEIGRRLTIIEVHNVMQPPQQDALPL